MCLTAYGYLSTVRCKFCNFNFRINSHENHNKMSLHNMATVFGPTLLRPGARSEGTGNTDLLAAGTVDVMAQAGILYFFLARRANGESLTNSQ